MDRPNVADQVEIMGLLARYAWAMDGKCSEQFMTVFLPDVAADYGAAGSYDDAMKMADAFDRFHAQFGSTQHLITNADIAVTGDTATCRSYFQATMTPPLDNDGAGSVEVQGFSTGGYYEDELVHTAGGWRIAKRTCIPVWFKPEPDVFVPNAMTLPVDDWGGETYGEP